MFEVTMLPAREGDCLLLRYGDPAGPRQVLIDAGRQATYPELLKALPMGERHLELFVVSHIDRDHIEGALQLLGEPDNGFSFEDIWFNAYRHLDWDGANETFGAVQGEKLTSLILRRRLPWNRAFDGAPVRLEGETPVRRVLPGGLALTLLSPDAARLKALERKWEAECRRVGLDPGHAAPAPEDPTDDPAGEAGIESFGGSLEALAQCATREDRAVANGSSIAFLAEYEGKCVLFAADAHPSILVRSLDLLGRPLPLVCALVKVAHHGSEANTTRALLDRIDSRNFFISTDGTQFYHPDEVAIARILTSPAHGIRTLFFNYFQDYTEPWDASSAQKQQYRYRCVFPETEGAPVTLTL